MRVCNVVLAAGGSKRMDDCKQLMKLEGRTLIRIVIENALHSMADGVVAVIGSRAEEVSKEVPTGPRIVINPDFATGQSSSVKAAVSSIPNFDAALFLLVDQPFVGPDIIDALIRRYRETGKPIVHPISGGRRVNPVLLDRSLFGEIEKLTGDMGARQLVDRRPDLVATIDVPEATRFMDIDTREDLKRAEEILRKEQRPH